MATTIYQTKKITLLNNVEIELIPLKLKYLREFMDIFQNVKNASNDDESIGILTQCTQIAMQQYCPSLSKTIDDVEENLTLPMIYDVLDIAAGIKINKTSEQTVQTQALESGSTWDNLDLAKLEAEVFILGIWKDYQELETSLSMPELLTTLEVSRELDYTEKKFLAAIQGVNLDEHAESGEERGQVEWENMKARVFSGGATNDANDILALQGQNATKAGFGIGMGLDYEDLR